MISMDHGCTGVCVGIRGGCVRSPWGRTDVPAGQWPQNPKHTAPAVVKGIVKKHKLGEEAAILYAQLRALPDPDRPRAYRLSPRLVAYRA